MAAVQQSQKQETQAKQEPEKELVGWSAPARPFKRRSRDFYVTIIAMAAVVGLVLFLVEGFLPVILIISLVFLFYVMSTVEPETINYSITTRGIKIAGSRTDWEAMSRFWFTKRFDSQLLVVETLSLPGRLELVINSEIKAKLEKEMSKFLTHEQVPPSVIDRTSGWFAKKLPGN